MWVNRRKAIETKQNILLKTRVVPKLFVLVIVLDMFVSLFSILTSMVYLQCTHPMPSAQHVLGPQTRFENDLLCQHHTVLRSEATLQSQNDSKTLISSTSEKKPSIGSTSYNVQQHSHIV